MVRGSIVSFDRVKGYGFVAPDAGGEDVFVHVNDLLDDKSLMVPGRTVEYILEEGDRGPKASEVRIVPLSESASTSRTSASRPQAYASDGDELCDVLSIGELNQELTEALLHTSPTLTGAQILDVRKRMVAIAQSHGWVDR